MLLRLLRKSIRGRAAHAALASGAVMVAATLVSALLNVALGVSENLAAELRAYGANIVVVPKHDAVEVEVSGLRYAAPTQAAYLDESDLGRLKTIFWGLNIVGFAPFLSGMVEIGATRALLVGTWFDHVVPQSTAGTPGDRGNARANAAEFHAGVRTVAPWWQIEGAWITDESSAALLGGELAQRLNVTVGDVVTVRAERVARDFRVRGVVHTGGPEEDHMFVDLAAAQALFDLAGKVDRVQVSALVKPDDALAVRGRRNPRALSAEDYERWYCSPYIDSVLYQIEEAIPGTTAKALRPVAEAETTVIERLTLTLVLLTAVAVVTAALAVLATVTTTVVQRRREVGLMKAIGGSAAQVACQFLSEAALYGLAGGTLGAGAGIAVARLIGRRVFETAISFNPITIPFTLGAALAVALVGAALPTWRAVRTDPLQTLRGA